MASGTITLTRAGTSSSGKMYGQIVWSATSNGSEANSSSVTATVQIKRQDGFSTTGTWKGSVTVGGSTKSISWYGTISNSWVTVATLTATVNHSSNGSGTCYIYAKVNGPSGTSQSGVYVSGSETVTLDTIPRQAVMTSATNFNDEGNPTIIYTNPLGSAAPSLQAGVSLTSASADVISWHNVDKTAGTDVIELTSSERTTLRKAVTSGNKRTVWIYLRTRIGETYYYSPMSKTLTIKNPEPTITPTIKDTDATTIALTGNSSKLVKYYSDAAITIGAAAVKEATIKSKKVTCGSKSLTADGTISNVESNEFIFTVTDSRGNTTTKTVSPTIVNYVKLTCTLANNMPDVNGNMTVKVNGNYFSGSFGATNNTLTVQYRYKQVGGSYGSWTTIASPTISGNTYSASTTITGLDYQTSYVFQTRATDKLATVTTPAKTVKSAPVFDWGENDFKFNVSVYDEFGALVGNGLAAYSGSGDNGIDPNTTLESLCLTSHSNAPQGKGTFYYIYTAFYSTKSTSAARAQIAFPYNKAGSMYHRYYASGAWSSWNSEHNHQYVTSAGSFRLAEGWMGFYDTLANAASHTNRKGYIGYDGGTVLKIVDGSNGMTLSSQGSIKIVGSDASTSVAFLNDRVRASDNDTYYLGDATYRWKAVYAVNGTIQTSDRNLKTNIEELDQKYIELFDKLLPVSFMFNDSESDRVHIGFISQDVKAAMDEVGLTDLDFAGFCRDVLTEWDEENQNDKIVLDDAGEPIYRYSLRYSEFIALNTRMIQINRQEIKSLRDELETLKNTIDKLTKELG